MGRNLCRWLDSLTSHPYSTNGSFLKVSCYRNLNLYHWTFHTVTLKSIGCPSTLNGSLTHAEFCGVLYWLFENNGALSYGPLSNCWHLSLCRIKEPCISTNLIRKSFLSVERLSNSWWRTDIFQDCNFSLKLWILSLAAITISYFPWQVYFIHFWESGQITKLYWVVLSNKNSIPWKKQLACELDNHASAFSWK